MSFSIPILFDDSPFFTEDDFCRRNRRNRATRGVQRQPAADVFQTWRENEPIFEESRYGTRFHGRPSYRGQQRDAEEVSRPLRASERRGRMRNYEEDEDENTEDPEEIAGVTGEMRDLRGLDGWDIPVQFGSPERSGPSRQSHVKWGHRPRQQVTTEVPVQRVRVCNRQEPSPRQVKVLRRPKADIAESPDHKTTRSDVLKTESNVETKSLDKSGNKEAKMGSDETKNLPSGVVDDEEMESHEGSRGNDSGIEIPVEHPFKRPKQKVEKRSSRRLSQCDPPPLAEIKIARIKSILEKTDGLEAKIEEFEDPIQNKNYLYISETLMKVLLDLDNVDSDGLDDVRAARKAGVKDVQNLVEKLENKLEENRRKNEATT